MRTESTIPARRRFAFGCAAGVLGTLVIQTIAFFGAVWLSQNQTTEKLAARMQPPPLPLHEMTYDWSLRTPEGGLFDLEAQRGKVLFITFWKPACPACKAHLPAIQRLEEMTAHPDAVFLPVVTEDDGNLAHEAAAAGLAMPYYVAEDALPRAIETATAPATFIIDRSGRVALRHMGTARWDDESVVYFMQTLLDAPAPVGIEP